MNILVKRGDRVRITEEALKTPLAPKNKMVGAIGTILDIEVGPFLYTMKLEWSPFGPETRWSNNWLDSGILEIYREYKDLWEKDLVIEI